MAEGIAVLEVRFGRRSHRFQRYRRVRITNS